MFFKFEFSKVSKGKELIDIAVDAERN